MSQKTLNRKIVFVKNENTNIFYQSLIGEPPSPAA